MTIDNPSADSVTRLGAPVEHGADAALDRLNLEQALRDFEVANAARHRPHPPAGRACTVSCSTARDELEPGQAPVPHPLRYRLNALASRRCDGAAAPALSGRTAAMSCDDPCRVGRAACPARHHGVQRSRRSYRTRSDRRCRIVTERHDLDVLVLDDHSPEPGWSERARRAVRRPRRPLLLQPAQPRHPAQRQPRAAARPTRRATAT